MSANDELVSGKTTPSSSEDAGPERRRRHGHRKRHYRHHHHRRRHLRQKLKIVVLVGLGLVVALVAWYLVVVYLDERALGTTSHHLAQVFGAGA